jgi:hypothetical protein
MNLIWVTIWVTEANKIYTGHGEKQSELDHLDGSKHSLCHKDFTTVETHSSQCLNKSHASKSGMEVYTFGKGWSIEMLPWPGNQEQL